jgi:hypothetical protein
MHPKLNASDTTISDEWGEGETGFDPVDVDDVDVALYTVLATIETDIDYIAQLSAAHDLLHREKVANQLLITQISKGEEYIKTATGIHNEMHATDMWLDDMQTATYQDAARSMAAVGMLAPLAGSLFYHSFVGIHRVLEEKGISVCSPARSQQDWDCHFVLNKDGDRRRNLVLGIIQLAESIGLDTHLPNNLHHTLQALFMYRNKMFRWGFEWPASQRRKFQKQLTRWPPGWFSASTHDNNPGIFYMTDTFIEHCFATIYLVLEGVGVYVRGKLGI